MFPVLQIRRPVVAAVCFAVLFAAQLAVFGVVKGAPAGDILLEAVAVVIVGSVVGAALNLRTRPEELSGLSATHVRSVIRCVRHGDVVDNPAIAESVIAYARCQERAEPWAGVCLAMLSVSAMTLAVGRPGGLSTVLIGLGLAGAGGVVLFELSRARRRRQAAVAAARAVLGET
jgi:hypothetical protein